MRTPAVTGRIMRKKWSLAIFAVFLMAGFLCVEPISPSTLPQPTATLLEELTIAVMVIVVMALGFVAFLFGKRTGQNHTR
jgi:uncharacterized membrane protein